MQASTLKGKITANAALKGKVAEEAAVKGNVVKPSVVAGVDGITYTPHVDDEGVLYWTNDGGRENPEPVKIKTQVDETLKFNENGVLGVNIATEVEKDNTLPISSAAVETTVGNIEILLSTI